MIIGVTGTNGGGKGAVVDYLEHKKGFAHYSVRDLLIEELKKQGLEVNRPNMGTVATRIREERAPGYFVDTFLERAQAAGETDIVIESIRSPGEAHRLKERGGFLLAVDAPLELRYQRIVGRGSHTDKVSLEEFRAHEDAEYRSADPSNHALMDVLGVMAAADATIMNDGSLRALHGKVDEALARFAV